MGCGFMLVFTFIVYVFMTLLIDGVLYLASLFIPGLVFVWWHGIVICTLLGVILFLIVMLEEKYL